MAKPFSELSNVLDTRKNEFLAGVAEVSRGAAERAGEAAVLGTRVDTGLARSNWVATIGVPTISVIPPYASGDKLGIGERGNAQGASGQHRAVIAGWPVLRGTALFIANNVSYIAILNFGGPNISPGNMLALARQAWTAFLKNPRRILR